ncbi:MAG: histidine phosphatase family protein [Acidobacteriota bacterium]
MSLELLVVRHAIAEERRPGLDEGDRVLTDDGRERFEREVQALVSTELRLDLVLTSPWVRARQTAELLAPITEGEVAETELLLGTPTRQLLELLPDGQRVAVVGHEPWLSELIAALTTGQLELSGAFALKKGGMAWLAGEIATGMTLKAFLPPKLLRGWAG